MVPLPDITVPEEHYVLQQTKQAGIHKVLALLEIVHGVQPGPATSTLYASLDSIQNKLLNSDRTLAEHEQLHAVAPDVSSDVILQWIASLDAHAVAKADRIPLLTRILFSYTNAAAVWNVFLACEPFLPDPPVGRKSNQKVVSGKQLLKVLKQYGDPNHKMFLGDMWQKCVFGSKQDQVSFPQLLHRMVSGNPAYSFRDQDNSVTAFGSPEEEIALFNVTSRSKSSS
jgi:hypothetical protein